MGASRRFCVLAGAAILIGAVVPSPSASGQGFQNWPAYLHDPAHSSQSADVDITSSSLSTLHAAWTFVPDPPTMPGQPGGGFRSSPIVVNGTVYVGASTGEFYALDEATGVVKWKLFTGFQPAITCAAKGTTATPTVARDPSTTRMTVYVAAADGNLWAIDATTGSVRWKVVVNTPSTTSNDYFAWGSPTISGGRIFVGSASSCDTPLVRGSVQSFNQTTGARLAAYYVVPTGAVGGGVWTTPAASGGSIWVTTGNADQNGTEPGDSNSIVRLDAATLTVQDKWTIPGITKLDDDFGASPTLFAAPVAGTRTSLVGACDKNGVFYAWRAQHLAAGPLWSFQAGDPASPGHGACLAGATWDASGRRLFHASNTTTINSKTYAASIRRVAPASGKPAWQLGLATGPVLGTPTLNGAGLLAAVTFNVFKSGTNALYLIDAGTGALLRTIALDSPTFPQVAFADNYLFVATGMELTAWTP